MSIVISLIPLYAPQYIKVRPLPFKHMILFNEIWADHEDGELPCVAMLTDPRKFIGPDCFVLSSNYLCTCMSVPHLCADQFIWSNRHTQVPH